VQEVGVNGSRRALVVDDPPLAIDCEAIATITDADLDVPAAWLPTLVFGHERRPDHRRALILVDGGRVEVPATMRLLESIEVLAMPELLAPSADRIGVTGLAMLPAGLTLFCDPRKVEGGWR
jgi:hypothetical protein